MGKIFSSSSSEYEDEILMDEATWIGCPVATNFVPTLPRGKQNQDLSVHRKSRGECVQCGELLPMTWKGLEECKKCNQ
jgi:hypothetical protein